MKKRMIALVMALVFVVSMAGVSFASDQSDGLSGLMDMISGIAQSAGSQSSNNEDASDSSGMISGISDIFSDLADSTGSQAGGNEDGSDVMAGIQDLISTIAGSISAETREDVIDEDVIGEEAASGLAGTLEGSEAGKIDADLDTVAGIAAVDPDMEYDTLADWDIMVPVPEGVTAVFSSDGYTLYPTDEQSIPYVRVNSYSGYSDEEELIDDLFDVMAADHDDLEILYGPEYVDAEGREYCEVVFEYDVQGYPVTDTRLITMAGGRAYMFTAKEVSELELYVDDLLEVVVLGSIFLGEDGGDIDVTVEEPQELAENELYWGMGLEVIDEYDLEGDFEIFDEVGLMMWLPDILSPAILPEEQPNPELFLGYYTTKDESAYASVVYQPADVTLEDYKELLGSMEGLIEDVEDFVINGLPFICYYIPSGDSMCLATVVDGGIVEFAFAPMSDEEFGAYAEVMGVSIQEAQ